MERLMKSLLLSVLVVGLLCTTVSAVMIKNVTTANTTFFDDYEQGTHDAQFDNGTNPGSWSVAGGSPPQSRVSEGPGAYQGDKYGYVARAGGEDPRQATAIGDVAIHTAGDVFHFQTPVRITSGASDYGFDLTLNDTLGTRWFNLISWAASPGPYYAFRDEGSRSWLDFGTNVQPNE